MGNPDDRYEYTEKVLCDRGCGYVAGSLGCSSDPHYDELRPHDLAGEIVFEVSDHSDFFVRNQAAMIAHQDLHPYGRYGQWLTVHRSLLNDHPMMRAVVVILYDRLRPWTRPDDRGWPDFVLFPRLERARLAGVRLRDRLRRD